MTDSSFEVLHRLRLKGIAGIEPLAATLEVAPDGVAAALDWLATQGIVRMMETPRLRGWRLTEAGAARHAAELVERRSAEVVDRLSPIYDEFLLRNARVKKLCASWQNLPPSDGGSRWMVIDELGEVADEMAPILEGAGGVVPRFAAYARRLAKALERLRAGDERYVTGVAIDSFHTIWFECHEDFLQTLGRDRTTEGSF